MSKADDGAYRAIKTRFFFDLANDRRFQGLGALDKSARQLPSPASVRSQAANEETPATIANDSSHSNRGAGRVGRKWRIQYGLNAGAKEFKFEGLQNDVSYNFALFSYINNANVKTTRFKATPTGKPIAFEITKLEDLGGGSVNVVWAESPQATAYKLRYGTATGNYTTTASEDAKSPTKVVGLPFDTPLFFQVYARNAAAEIAANAEMSITLKDNTLPLGGTVADLQGTVKLTSDVGGVTTVTSEAKGSPAFNYPTRSVSGTAYTAAVLDQPAHQVCEVKEGGTGTFTADSTNAVKVTCVYKTYAIGGTVSGQTAPLTVTNGTKSVDVAADGTLYALEGLGALSAQTLTITTDANIQTCTVAASGTTTSLDDNVVDANIACSSVSHKVGGTLSGMASGTLGLKLNGGDVLNLTADGSFQFPPALAYNATYAVTLDSEPAGHDCQVANASGTIKGDVSNVTVTCVAAYVITITVSGLGVSNEVKVKSYLAPRQPDEVLTITADGTYQFTKTVNHGDQTDVRVLVQPSGKSCILTNDFVDPTTAPVTVGMTCS